MMHVLVLTDHTATWAFNIILFLSANEMKFRNLLKYKEKPNLYVIITEKKYLFLF